MMGIFEMGSDEEVSVTVLFKDAQPEYFNRVLTVEINDKWLKIFYFNEARNKKHVAIFRVDNPNFIGYGYEPNEVEIWV